MFTKEVISMDIGTRYIKIAIGKEKNGSIIIKNAFKLDTPTNSIKDGNILDLNSIKSLISKKILEEKVKAKRVIVTVQSSSIIKRELVLPKVKEEELNSIVNIEIEQYLPIMLSDYLIDYKVLEEFEEDNVKKVRILVVIAPKALVERYLKLIKELNLKPYVLDVNSNVISKLFSSDMLINSENYSFDKTVAVIDLGNEQINVNIISRGILSFSRLINNGGRELDINIANSFNLNLIEAEKRKIETIDLFENEIDMTSTQVLNNVARNTIDIWIEEIDKIFNYYTSRSLGNKIDCIYLYGGSSNIKGIEDYFAKKLNIITKKISDVGLVNVNNEINDKEISIFLNSVSAIIRR
ncbi:type IV pilus assembly protein PilM [Caloranaerobacter ferrireducens]|uniref:type IV pilus assembly protein PilM n=1 Tax=Caloranaerobacter ferrireducens TaxID=1323370 RepID=UPI00084D98E4|nr:type IV pilus assembly protein PilM [Caloranaerobacter ferrireducens]